MYIIVAGVDWSMSLVLACIRLAQFLSHSLTVGFVYL